MSISGLLVRFAAAYVLLLAIATGVAMSLPGAKFNLGVNVAMLLAAVTWVCMAFGQKNGRYFTREEKTRAVLGMLATDMVIQVVAVVGLGLLSGTSMQELKLALLVLPFVGLLHAAVIYFFASLAGRQLAKAAARAASSKSG